MTRYLITDRTSGDTFITDGTRMNGPLYWEEYQNPYSGMLRSEFDMFDWELDEEFTGNLDEENTWRFLAQQES